MSDPGLLVGQIAVVTGATRGIGRTLAIRPAVQEAGVRILNRNVVRAVFVPTSKWH